MEWKGSLDLPDEKGRTPLQYAVIKGHVDVVKFLISDEGKCALDSQDKQGYSPLMHACQFNRVDIAKDLLQEAEKKGALKSLLVISDNFG